MDRETLWSSSTWKETVCTNNRVRSLQRNTCSKRCPPASQVFLERNPPKTAASLNTSSVLLSSLRPRPCFGSVCCLRPLLGELGDVDAVEVVGAKGTVALGALPLSGVVTHLETLVAEHVETLGEHRLLVSGVAAGAAQLGLQTQTCTSQTMTDQCFLFFSNHLYFTEQRLPVGVLMGTFLDFLGRLNSHTA